LDGGAAAAGGTLAWGKTAVMLASISAVMDAADQMEYERILAAIRAQLSQAAFDAAYNQGRTLTTDQAIEEARTFAHAVEAGVIGSPCARNAPFIGT
jgi:hypothetical protein